MQDPLCTAVLIAIFFMNTPTRNIVYFLVLLAVKHANFCDSKVYTALNDLHNLKILLCECKMSFKIGSLRCVKYIEKKPTQYQPNFWGGGQRSVQNFKTGSEKKWMPGGLKEFIPQILLFLAKEKLNKLWGLKCWS